jgi:hypothetical protein
VTAPLDLTGLKASYLVADGAGFQRVDAEADAANGLWKTKLRAAAPVEFTLPDVPAPIPRQFAFPSEKLQVLYALLEHPDRAPAPDGATFTVTADMDTLPAMGEVFQVYVVGAWIARNFAATEVTVTGNLLTPPAFSFLPVNSQSGRSQLDLITKRDAFLVLRYVGTTLTGAAEAPAFDQTGAATTVPQAEMDLVLRDQMLDLKVAPAAVMSRYSHVLPVVDTLAMNWSVVAAPGYKIASTSGPVLESGSLMTTSTGITVPYGNPFAQRGWNTIFTLATSQSRIYMPPLGPMGMPTPITLFAGMNQFVEPTAGASLDLPARLPIKVLYEGVSLTSDGLTVKQPSSVVTVTLELESDTSSPEPEVSVYNLQVFDLVLNATSTALERRTVYAAASDQAMFELPPEIFEVGHRYTLRAQTTHGGFPSVRDGNFLDRTLPLSQAYLDSGVFTVTP